MKTTFYLTVLVLLVLLPALVQVSPIGLQPGDQAPAFQLKDQNDKEFILPEKLKKGPVVVFFYRAEWCPFCNMYITNIQDSLDLIYKKGASVCGISPQKPEGIEVTIEKTAAEFPLLYDEDNIVSKSFNTFDANTNLPVPATYVIGADGKVKFVHFNKDYRVRPSVQQLLQALN
ncbi:MAG: peroxiredoxin family protein [Cytophagaceae bacterium]|nr:peroxiredoxin family protein [Cytophagaceae bacterium]